MNINLKQAVVAVGAGDPVASGLVVSLARPGGNVTGISDNATTLSTKSGKKSSGTWKLDTSGFCTSWKGAETNCYTVVPSGKNKWSIQKGSTAVAVWSK